MNHTHTLTPSLQTGLGFYFLLVAAMNVGFSAYFYYTLKNMLQAIIWLAVAAVFLIHAVAYFAHADWIIPSFVQESINFVMNPVSYFVVAVLALVLGLTFRK